MIELDRAWAQIKRLHAERFGNWDLSRKLTQAD